MTTKEKAIDLTRKSNLTFLQSEMQAAYKRFRAVKTLLREQGAISLTEAIGLVEADKTLETIDADNIDAKIQEVLDRDTD